MKNPGIFVPSCAAINCDRINGKHPSKFFPFPNNPFRCQLWVVKCRRLDLFSVPVPILSKHYGLCEKHFEVNCFLAYNTKLNHDAVPTLFDFPMVKYRVPRLNSIPDDEESDCEIVAGIKFKSINRCVQCDDNKMFICGGPLLDFCTIKRCRNDANGLNECQIQSDSESTNSSLYSAAIVGIIELSIGYGEIKSLQLFNVLTAYSMPHWLSDTYRFNHLVKGKTLVHNCENIKFLSCINLSNSISINSLTGEQCEIIRRETERLNNDPFSFFSLPNSKNINQDEGKYFGAAPIPPPLPILSQGYRKIPQKPFILKRGKHSENNNLFVYESRPSMKDNTNLHSGMDIQTFAWPESKTKVVSNPQSRNADWTVELNVGREQNVYPTSHSILNSNDKPQPIADCEDNRVGNISYKITSHENFHNYCKSSNDLPVITEVFSFAKESCKPNNLNPCLQEDRTNLAKVDHTTQTNETNSSTKPVNIKDLSGNKIFIKTNSESLKSQKIKQPVTSGNSQTENLTSSNNNNENLNNESVNIVNNLNFNGGIVFLMLPQSGLGNGNILIPTASHNANHPLQLNSISGKSGEISLKNPCNTENHKLLQRVNHDKSKSKDQFKSCSKPNVRETIVYQNRVTDSSFNGNNLSGVIGMIQKNNASLGPNLSNKLLPLSQPQQKITNQKHQNKLVLSEVKLLGDKVTPVVQKSCFKDSSTQCKKVVMKNSLNLPPQADSLTVIQDESNREMPVDTDKSLQVRLAYQNLMKALNLKGDYLLKIVDSKCSRNRKTGNTKQAPSKGILLTVNEVDGNEATKLCSASVPLSDPSIPTETVVNNDHSGKSSKHDGMSHLLHKNSETDCTDHSHKSSNCDQSGTGGHSDKGSQCDGVKRYPSKLNKVSSTDPNTVGAIKKSFKEYSIKVNPSTVHHENSQLDEEVVIDGIIDDRQKCFDLSNCQFIGKSCKTVCYDSMLVEFSNTLQSIKNPVTKANNTAKVVTSNEMTEKNIAAVTRKQIVENRISKKNCNDNTSSIPPKLLSTNPVVSASHLTNDLQHLIKNHDGKTSFCAMQINKELPSEITRISKCRQFENVNKESQELLLQIVVKGSATTVSPMSNSQPPLSLKSNSDHCEQNYQKSISLDNSNLDNVMEIEDVSTEKNCLVPEERSLLEPTSIRVGSEENVYGKNTFTMSSQNCDKFQQGDLCSSKSNLNYEMEQNVTNDNTNSLIRDDPKEGSSVKNVVKNFVALTSETNVCKRKRIMNNAMQISVNDDLLPDSLKELIKNAAPGAGKLMFMTDPNDLLNCQETNTIPSYMKNVIKSISPKIGKVVLLKGMDLGKETKGNSSSAIALLSDNSHTNYSHSLTTVNVHDDLPPPLLLNEEVKAVEVYKPASLNEVNENKKNNTMKVYVPLSLDFPVNISRLSETNIKKLPERIQPVARHFLDLKIEKTKLKQKIHSLKYKLSLLKKGPKMNDRLMNLLRTKLSPEAYSIVSTTMLDSKIKGARYSDCLKKIAARITFCKNGWEALKYLSTIFSFPCRKVVSRFICDAMADLDKDSTPVTSDETTPACVSLEQSIESVVRGTNATDVIGDYNKWDEIEQLVNDFNVEELNDIDPNKFDNFYEALFQKKQCNERKVKLAERKVKLAERKVKLAERKAKLAEKKKKVKKKSANSRDIVKSPKKNPLTSPGSKSCVRRTSVAHHNVSSDPLINLTVDELRRQQFLDSIEIMYGIQCNEPSSS